MSTGSAIRHPCRVDDLTAGQIRPQADVSGHIRQPAMQLDGVAPRVLTKQFDIAGVGAKQAEQDANGRGLARAVRTEKPVDLTDLDRQVETVERARRSEALRETRSRDGVGHAGTLLARRAGVKYTVRDIERGSSKRDSHGASSSVHRRKWDDWQPIRRQDGAAGLVA